MKVPTPRRLKSGLWFIQLRLNGQSIPVTAETKTDCIRIAEKIKADHRTDINPIKKLPKSLTLRECVSTYINKYQNTLSPSTVDRYRVYRECRFKNYMDKPIGTINWQRMIDDELQLVSEKTVYNGWGLVRPSLKLVGYPVPQIRLAQVPVKEIPFLQPEEIKKFCAEIKGKSYEIAALLELHGLRLSEMKALTWEDIDLEHNVINVNGAYVKGEDGYVDKPTNKNSTSTRPVPIMIPQLTDALNAVENKTGRVVTIYPSVLLRDVKRACRKAGVTECGNHSLRHSFASLCFFLGIPMRQIQEWGGWSNSDTLTKIYIRLSASAKTQYQRNFSDFFSC